MKTAKYWLGLANLSEITKNGLPDFLDEKIHGMGKGTALLSALKENETVLNAWVIDKEEAIKQNGEIYKSPLNFYLKNGFMVYPEMRLENEKMSAVKIIWKEGRRI
ncbi:hypothetical protein [Pedobacter mendelii]|uniref:Uncharacterized protein n=1 Tax=Pedobacter mendelii TaxID=1908240 RepID=A0ABQ2BKZ8_9SPHI|nr:hypothetical protein [Pedobacter mendelii]GGI27649.1 hypothetical protein GCM10008119_28700 [Pedobacter mendelii]